MEKQPGQRTVLAEMEYVLCESSITIAGQTLKPDATKAYVEFWLSHSLPVVYSGGMAIHPQVVANSYKSLLHQQFDFAHQVRIFDKENIPKDRMLGSVVAVEFPDTPYGGWKVPATMEEAPGIRGVAVLHKLAHGADLIIGQQQASRRKRTVSIEVVALVADSGFLVRSEKPLPNNLGAKTPDDIRQHGWWYVAAADAPPDLVACWGQGEMDGPWKGKEAVLLNGALDGQIHYFGVGLVDQGKEPTARVTQFLAGKEIKDAETPNKDGLLKAQKDFVKIIRKSVDALSELCSHSDIGLKK